MADEKRIGGYVEYKMSEQMALDLLKAGKIKDGPMSKRGQKYLCEVVNEQFGVRGECIGVLIS